MSDPSLQQWEVPAEAAGERLDRALASHLDTPRHQVQQWLDAGRVTLGGRPAKPSHRLSGGEVVTVDRPSGGRDERVAPEAGELVVLFEDAELIVVDKPPGLTVHPGAGRPHGTLVHRLMAHYPELAGVGGSGRPGIVHRLDKDTSGVMVVARTAAAYQALARDFAQRRVKKEYLAVVYGTPKQAAGTIDAPIGRHRERRTEMTVRADGRPAVTHYRVGASAAGLSLLEIGLETGRTHQIRVHAKHLGHPLVGDPVYGEARHRGLARPLHRPLMGFPRPALHAWRLTLTHPTSGAPLTFEAGVPADLQTLWLAVTGQPWPVIRPLLPRP